MPESTKSNLKDQITGTSGSPTVPMATPLPSVTPVSEDDYLKEFADPSSTTLIPPDSGDDYLKEFADPSQVAPVSPAAPVPSEPPLLPKSHTPDAAKLRSYMLADKEYGRKLAYLKANFGDKPWFKEREEYNVLPVNISKKSGKVFLDRLLQFLKEPGNVDFLDKMHNRYAYGNLVTQELGDLGKEGIQGKSADPHILGWKWQEPILDIIQKKYLLDNPDENLWTATLLRESVNQQMQHDYRKPTFLEEHGGKLGRYLQQFSDEASEEGFTNKKGSWDIMPKSGMYTDLKEADIIEKYPELYKFLKAPLHSIVSLGTPLLAEADTMISKMPDKTMFDRGVKFNARLAASSNAVSLGVAKFVADQADAALGNSLMRLYASASVFEPSVILDALNLAVGISATKDLIKMTPGLVELAGKGGVTVVKQVAKLPKIAKDVTTNLLKMTKELGVRPKTLAENLAKQFRNYADVANYHLSVRPNNKLSEKYISNWIGEEIQRTGGLPAKDPDAARRFGEYLLQIDSPPQTPPLELLQRPFSKLEEIPLPGSDVSPSTSPLRLNRRSGTWAVGPPPKPKLQGAVPPKAPISLVEEAPVTPLGLIPRGSKNSTLVAPAIMGITSPEIQRYLESDQVVPRRKFDFSPEDRDMENKLISEMFGLDPKDETPLDKELFIRMLFGGGR